MATCRGIDVSTYQPPQDWEAHEENGLVFAFAKASEGMHSRDSRFKTHITGIKAAGLVPGAYHYAWPNQNVADEAANYIAAVKPYASKGFTHWLDLERYEDGRNYSGRTATQIKAWVSAWATDVQRAFPGQRVGIYTSQSDLAAGRVPTNLPLWYPAYPGPSADTYAEAEKRARPNPSGRAPMIWQFTSNPATGPNLDLNLCYMSAADLRTWAGGAIVPPKYEPFPGAAWFSVGRKHPVVAAMHARLVAVGCNHYKSTANKDTLGSGDKASYEAWQRLYSVRHAKGWTGAALKWPPGKETWDALQVPNV